MHVLTDVSTIVEREENLRDDIASLSPVRQRLYFKVLQKQVKDPDTYATLAYALLCGFHFLYLKQYVAFGLHVALIMLCVSLWIATPVGLYGFLVLALIQLPHLFFSQKIVRLYNYNVASRVYEQVVDMRNLASNLN
ncbi:hypothetical protein ACP3V3_19650 [Vibrio sp. PNB22_3_1]